MVRLFCSDGSGALHLRGMGLPALVNLEPCLGVRPLRRLNFSLSNFCRYLLISSGQFSFMISFFPQLNRHNFQILHRED